jgi:hypothetical protein
MPKAASSLILRWRNQKMQLFCGTRILTVRAELSIRGGIAKKLASAMFNAKLARALIQVSPKQIR